MDEKSGESDFFNRLFDYSPDELERLSPHSGDECISLSIPQTSHGTSTSLDVSFSEGRPFQPQDTLPSDLCDDFSQFFDSQATQLSGDCASYFEARGPTELEPQDLAILWSGDRRTSQSPPCMDTGPPPWTSASSTSTSAMALYLITSPSLLCNLTALCTTLG